MDRELKALLKRMICHSQELEGALVRSNIDLLATLSELGSLERITHQSLFPTATATPQPQRQAFQQQQVIIEQPKRVEPPIPTPAPPRRSYSSTNSQYKPALSNESIIDALLQFHRRSKPGQPATTATGSPKKSNDGFAPATVPELETELKKNSRFQRGEPAISYPILRSKRDY